MANLSSINVSNATNVQSPQVLNQDGTNLQSNIQNLTGQTNQQTQAEREKLLIYQWITELTNVDTRENALLELSKKRESVSDLGI